MTNKDNMRIIVCVKQVPDTTEVRIDPKTGTMIRDGVESILNPDDKNALEQALVIKDERTKEGLTTEVTVLSMGPAQAEEMLAECLAMGADRAVLLCDRAFAGSDTWATSNVLASAIKKLGDFDLVLAGRQAIDGDTAQVGPQIAERLNIPQITYVQKLRLFYEPDGRACLEAERMLEDGYEVVRAQLPALITAVKELNEPRYMSIRGIYRAFSEKIIDVWMLKDLDIDASQAGLQASPTRVRRSFAPPLKAPGRMLEGEIPQMTDELVSELKKAHVI